MLLLLFLFLLLLLIITYYNKEAFRSDREYRIMPSRMKLAWIHKYGRKILEDNQLSQSQKLYRISKEFTHDLTKNVNLFNYDGYNDYRVW